MSGRWSREGVQFIPPEEVLAGAPAETRRLRLRFCWQVEVRQGGKPTAWDKVFGLRFEGQPENRSRALFFLEADWGTMPGSPEGDSSRPPSPRISGDLEAGAAQDAPRPLELPGPDCHDEQGTDLAPHGSMPLALGGGSLLFLFTDRESLTQEDILGWVNGWGEIARGAPFPTGEPARAGAKPLIRRMLFAIPLASGRVASPGPSSADR